MKNLMMLLVVAVALCAAFASTPAQAQATRTWVSGVGDDVNPCSRTAPCKTFAGAISKTAAGGEINCLDPGGFGAVTITKNMTIDCDYTEGGVLAGGNGIVVNGAGIVVRLRGLDIFGVNPPSNGVRFLAGAALIIDHCRIARFNSASSWGVSFQPSEAARLVITDTLINDNGNPAVPATAGGGILVQPTGAGGSATVTLDNVRLVGNSQGLRAESTGSANPIRGTINRSTASNNYYLGFAAVASGGSGPVSLMVDNSTASFNGGAGFTANGAGTLIRMGRSVSTGNATGTLPNNTGVIESYGTNQVRGNTVDGSRTSIAME
jgi:hypothetical protein